MNERSSIFSYIEKVVKEKMAKGKYPFCCSLLDISSEFPTIPTAYIKECMRELHRLGTFKAGLTINKIPIIIYDLQQTSNLRTTAKQE